MNSFYRKAILLVILLTFLNVFTSQISFHEYEVLPNGDLVHSTIDISISLIKYNKFDEFEKHLHEYNVHLNEIVDVKTGDTLLHLACKYGSYQVAELLLRKGANINAHNHYKKTSLMIAINSGFEDLAILLIRSRKINWYEEGEITSLMMAATRKLSNIVNALLEYDAKVNLRTNSGETALMFGCISGDAAIVRQLINYGAKYDSMNSNNMTPLMLGSSRGHLEVVKELLEINRSPEYLNMKDVSQRTALDIALDGNHNDVAKLLLQAGAKTNSRKSYHVFD